MNGYKTYTMIGLSAAALAVSVAARHGLDLGTFGPDIADAVTALLLTGAAWARSVARPQQPVDDQTAVVQMAPRL